MDLEMTSFRDLEMGIIHGLRDETFRDLEMGIIQRLIDGHHSWT